MKNEPGTSTRERLAGIFAAWTGIDFGRRRENLIDFAQRRAVALGLPSPAAYVRHLDGSLPPREMALEIDHLLEMLNISETYFLRAEEQIRHLVDIAIPARLCDLPARPLRFLSAGCSSGEEAYSLALALLDSPLSRAGIHFEIIGLDLDERLLARARAARYSSWSLRQVPLSLRGRHFVPEGSMFRVADPVRSKVTFVKQNLITGTRGHLGAGSFDAVFCRNVLMYLEKEATLRVLEGIEQALVPDGLLYLGHAENLRGLGIELSLKHEGSAFCYRRSPRAPAVRSGPPTAAGPSLARPPPPRESATERPPAATAVPPVTGGDAFRAVLALVAEERLVEAAERIESWSESERSAPASRLLLAAILAVLGDDGRAEELGRDLLEDDPESAEAHFVLALCQESRGEWDDAIERTRQAITLAPGFAIARFHLGRLLRQAGRMDEARAELTEACTRLETEDPDRVTLYGGGFPRDVLIRLCRSELKYAEVIP